MSAAETRDVGQESSGGPCAVPIHEQAQGLRDHYERVSMAACEWSNQIPRAIDLWEREKLREESEASRVEPGATAPSGKDGGSAAGVDLAAFEGHTPGPWRWVGDPRSSCMPSLVGASGPVCDFGIAEQYYPTAGSPPEGPDAELIRAAPTLLAELRRLRAALTEIANDVGGCPAEDAHAELVEIARRALTPASEDPARAPTNGDEP